MSIRREAEHQRSKEITSELIVGPYGVDRAPWELWLNDP